MVVIFILENIDDSPSQQINSRKTNGIFKIFIMLVWLVGIGATLGAQWRSMRAQMSGGDEFYCVYGRPIYRAQSHNQKELVARCTNTV